MFIKDSEKTAIAWHEDKISYRRLLQNINYYSSLFAKNEEGKAAIYSPNRPEWVYAFYSIWKNQSIAVPIDFMSTVDEVAYILNDCRPEVIFISNETKNSFANILPLLNYSLTVFNLDEISDKHQQYSAEEIGGYDVTKTAIIVYTSGTTGTPKGVMLSYDNLLSNIEAVSEHISIYSESRNVLALLPFHHILPLMGTVIIPLKVHTTIGFSPSMVSEDIISTLQKNNISIIIGVPRLYAAIRKGVMDKINSNGVAKALFRIAHLVNSQSFSKKIFKKVHDKFGGKVAFMVCGGAKLDEDMANDYKTLGFEMLEGFGMTEAAPMITFTRPGRWKIGSPGEVMPGLEIKIVDGEKERMPKLGEKTIENDYLETILKIQKFFQEELKLEIKEFIVFPQRLNLRMVEGFEIYFDPRADIDWQLTKLNSVLKEKIPPEKRKDLEYIELRFGDLAPFKYR